MRWTTVYNIRRSACIRNPPETISISLYGTVSPHLSPIPHFVRCRLNMGHPCTFLITSLHYESRSEIILFQLSIRVVNDPNDDPRNRWQNLGGVWTPSLFSSQAWRSHRKPAGTRMVGRSDHGRTFSNEFFKRLCMSDPLTFWNTYQPSIPNVSENIKTIIFRIIDQDERRRLERPTSIFWTD